jgi:hypothetical protein
MNTQSMKPHMLLPETPDHTFVLRCVAAVLPKVTGAVGVSSWGAAGASFAVAAALKE